MATSDFWTGPAGRWLGLGAGASAEELTRQLAVLRRGTRRQLRAGAAHNELQDQLGILERIRAAVHSRAVQALGHQGRFLRERFSRSELDL